MQHAKIIGSGMFIPPFVMTNEDLCKIFPTGRLPKFNQNFDWSPEWIEKKLGIKERCFAFDFEAKAMREGYYDLDLAEKASRNALQDANVNIEDVDTIIYVSSTPEYFMPDPACMLHMRLAAREDTAAFGLTSVGCGGFIYAMIDANSLIASGEAETVLISASISTSSYAACYYEPNITKERRHALMARDRFNASLFGDGASAMVLHKTSSLAREGFLFTYRGATGINNFATFAGGGSRHPSTLESVLSGIHHFNLDALAVLRNAPAIFEKTVQKVLKKTGLAVKDIDYFVFHQINRVILESITRRLDIPPEKFGIHVDRFGNLDTATLAVGFHEAKTAGKIQAGNLVLFSAVGAGLQYGSAIVRI